MCRCRRTRRLLWRLPRQHRSTSLVRGTTPSPTRSYARERIADPVHPRACGERGEKAFKHNQSAGSSPRVRGTPSEHERDRLQGRFIPARAGNAPNTSICGRALPVHPRACGERGSSADRGDGRAAVHPRACGERLCPRYLIEDPPAVHPRACGERITNQRHCADHVRFIPARAGNARRAVADQCAAGSSPRVRGTPVQDVVCGVSAGSSPRVRGTLVAIPVHLTANRFIPAPAGNAAVLRAARTRRFGSSPRVRGTLCCGCSTSPDRRFIPARAGNAHSSDTRQAVRPVHPRACGERRSR